MANAIVRSVVTLYKERRVPGCLTPGPLAPSWLHEFLGFGVATVVSGGRAYAPREPTIPSTAAK